MKHQCNEHWKFWTRFFLNGVRSREWERRERRELECNIYTIRSSVKLWSGWHLLLRKLCSVVVQRFCGNSFKISIVFIRTRLNENQISQEFFKTKNGKDAISIRCYNFWDKAPIASSKCRHFFQDANDSQVKNNRYEDETQSSESLWKENI